MTTDVDAVMAVVTALGRQQRFEPRKQLTLPTFLSIVLSERT